MFCFAPPDLPADAVPKGVLHPRRVFKGVVDSLSAGSAASFSLLPPQNTTGNWVKVTQRIPVRVRLLENDPQYPFHYGASAQATIQLQEPLLQPVAGPDAQ